MKKKNKINQNNRFSDKFSSEDFYNINIEKLTFINEKRLSNCFFNDKRKIKKTNKKLLKEIMIYKIKEKVKIFLLFILFSCYNSKKEGGVENA